MKSCIKYRSMAPGMFVFRISIIISVVRFWRSRKKKLNNFKGSRVIRVNYYLCVDTSFVSKFRSKPNCLGLKFEEISPDLIFSIVSCNICTFTTVFWLPFGVRFAFILSVFFFLFFFFKCCDYFLFIFDVLEERGKKLYVSRCIRRFTSKKLNFFVIFDESPLDCQKNSCFFADFQSLFFEYGFRLRFLDNCIVFVLYSF